MRFLLILAAKLDQAPAASLRQQCTLSDIQVLLSHILDETTIEALQSNRLMGQDLHNMIGCNVRRWISKHQELSSAGARPEAGCCCQCGAAGAVRPADSSRRMNTVFG